VSLNPARIKAFVWCFSLSSSARKNGFILDLICFIAPREVVGKAVGRCKGGQRTPENIAVQCSSTKPLRLLWISNDGEQGRTVYWRKGCPVNTVDIASKSALIKSKPTVDPGNRVGRSGTPPFAKNVSVSQFDSGHAGSPGQKIEFRREEGRNA